MHACTMTVFVHTHIKKVYHKKNCVTIFFFWWLKATTGSQKGSQSPPQELEGRACSALIFQYFKILTRGCFLISLFKASLHDIQDFLFLQVFGVLEVIFQFLEYLKMSFLILQNCNYRLFNYLSSLNASLYDIVDCFWIFAINMFFEVLKF